MVISFQRYLLRLSTPLISIILAQPIWETLRIEYAAGVWSNVLWWLNSRFHFNFQKERLQTNENLSSWKKPANCRSFENIFFIYPRKVFFCISTKPENRWRVVLRFCRQYFLLSITPPSISQCLYFVFWIPEMSEKKRKGKNINSWRPSLPGGCRPVPSGATITPAGRENTLYPTCQTCWYQ